MRAYTTLNGLQTSSYTATNSGTYSATIRTTMQLGSAVVVTVTQSGSRSQVYTMALTSPVSDNNEMTGLFNCAMGDLITVAISSSATADQPPVDLQTTINIRQGI